MAHRILPLLFTLAACQTPYPERDEVVAVCTRFLDDVSQRRWPQANAAIADGAVSVHEVDKVRIQPMRSFMAGLEAFVNADPEYREWIEGTPTVLVEGNHATVWAGFRVTYKGGKGSGLDAFHLVRIDGNWQIVALCDVFRPDR